MTTKTAPLVLLEGPDGGGKTTLAKRLLELILGSRYVHYNNLPEIVWDLGQVYTNAMLPAQWGFAPVIIDRAWYSELVYADVYRNGVRRLSDLEIRMLERTAMRCDMLVVWCLPDVERCVQTFESRKEIEYLDSSEELRAVHRGYNKLINSGSCALQQTIYDYQHDGEATIRSILEHVKRDRFRHDASFVSGGDLEAQTIVVVDPPDMQDCSNSPLRVPGVAFNPPLQQSTHDPTNVTRMFHQEGVKESELLWLGFKDFVRFYDQDPIRNRKILAVGGEIYQQFQAAGLAHIVHRVVTF